MRRTRLLALLSVIVPATSPVSADTGTTSRIIVTRTDDPEPDGCTAEDCSLREAVLHANETVGPDTVALAAGTYVLTHAQGGLLLSDDVEIRGTGVVRVDAAALAQRIVHVRSGVDAVLHGLILAGGNVEGVGGAVLNEGVLHMESCFLEGNHASLNGGGMFTTGAATLRRVTLQNNTSGADGAGISAQGSLTLEEVTLRHNNAGDGLTVSMAGGIVLWSGELTGAQVVLVDNSPSGIVSMGRVTLTDSDLRHHAGTGALVMYGGSLEAEDLRVVGNLRSGLQVGESGEMRLWRCHVEGNEGAWGGGIYNALGTLTLEDCVVRGNHATQGGGGGVLASEGFFTITRTVVEFNASAGAGGGLYLEDGSQVDMIGTSVHGNVSEGHGGGVYASAVSLDVVDSTLSGNEGAKGGGLFLMDGELLATNSTFSGNVAAMTGGGLHSVAATVVLDSVTVAFNRADTGHSLFHDDEEGPLATTNTILASGEGRDECVGTVWSNGHNLVEHLGACALRSVDTDLINKPANLLPLADNGGTTPTHAPGESSPVVDVGSAVCPAVDQRGESRPRDGNGDGQVRCDIGAVESLAEGTTASTIIETQLPYAF